MQRWAFWVRSCSLQANRTYIQKGKRGDNSRICDYGGDEDYGEANGDYEDEDYEEDENYVEVDGDYEEDTEDEDCKEDEDYEEDEEANGDY